MLHRRDLRLLALAAHLCAVCPARAGTDAGPPFGELPLVEEIDTATVPPSDEEPSRASTTGELLGRPARQLAPGPAAKAMTYRIGRGKGLVAGEAYLLSIEFPDDLPRAMFIMNRGSETARGFATGQALGDARMQYAPPSLESLDYPQSGSWQTYRSFFVLGEHFTDRKGQRNDLYVRRPLVPADGFDVTIFQTRQPNDPRSAGAATGKIRLFHVPDAARFDAPQHPPPAGLPRRHIFWREEMADSAILPTLRQPWAERHRLFAKPLDWFSSKMRLAKFLGANTFSKDVLEFGFNQGFISGDEKWYVSPPVCFWDELVAKAGEMNLMVLPYYEYKGSLGPKGTQPPSGLGWERRAQKLWYGVHGPGYNGSNDMYSGVWWTEDKNVDLTDPATAADLERLLDRTIVRLKDKATFVGAWIRTRNSSLPVSFAPAALARYQSENPGAPDARRTSIEALREESQAWSDAFLAARRAKQPLPRTPTPLLDSYLDWWTGKRADFLLGVRNHLAAALGNDKAIVFFTAYTTESVPALLQPGLEPSGGEIGIVTDQPEWWKNYAASSGDEYRYRWSSADFAALAASTRYSDRLLQWFPVHQNEWNKDVWTEESHSAPPPDPARYRTLRGVLPTYPFGALYTVSNPADMERFRSGSGLAIVRHFSLNEDDGFSIEGGKIGPNGELSGITSRRGIDPAGKPTREVAMWPFGGTVGYVSVDVDRAGPFSMLAEARAVANADPHHIGYLSGSSFSRGFPEYTRAFNQAFLSLPALPSKRLPAATSNPKVVVREIPTGKLGTYFAVVNPEMTTESATINFPNDRETEDLTGGTRCRGPVKLSLYPGQLKTYRTAASPGH